MQDLVEKGDLGMKSGKGFYDWTDEMKNKDNPAQDRNPGAFP